MIASLLLAALPADSSWTTEIVHQAPGKVGGCAIGDLRPDVPGLEIGIVGIDGSVYVLSRTRLGWQSELAYQAPGEMIQCAIGDIDPDRPGDELALVGMAEGPEQDAGPGAAHWVYRDEGRWGGGEIFGTEGLVHGVCITRGSVFVTGYDDLAHRLWRADGEWTSEVIAELPGAGKSAVTYDRGVAFACLDGSVVAVRREGTDWVSEVVDERDTGRARLASFGPRLVVADDDGTLSVLDVGEPIRTKVSYDKLRGAALGDFDPGTPGFEAATVGYDRTLTVLYPRVGEWAQHRLFVDTDRFHHLASGDVDNDGRPELVACGYTGRIVLVDCRVVE